jgi:hypothetical protein
MELEVGKRYKEIEVTTSKETITLYDCDVLDRVSVNEGLGEPEYVIGHRAVVVRASMVTGVVEA